MEFVPGQMLEVMEQRNVEIAPAMWYLTSRLCWLSKEIFVKETPMKSIYDH